MNATLWVIWPAVTVAALFSGLAIGSHFPAKHLLNAEYWNGRRDEAKVIDRFRDQALDRAWRDGYERGCNDELASCAPCEHEPLARGAAESPEAVTTAPCSSEDGHSHAAPKGDSPGPGNCPCCGSALRDVHDDAPFCWDCGLYARDPAADCDNEDHKPAVDFVFVPANSGPMPSPIFDALATEHPTLATPPTSPPGGVAPEPSAPVLAPANNWHDPGAEVKPPGPAMVPGEMPATQAATVLPGYPSTAGHTGNHGETAGPGADPWQEIVAANQEVWEPFTDTDVFRRISGDLDALRSALSAPVQLPPWKDSQ